MVATAIIVYIPLMVLTAIVTVWTLVAPKSFGRCVKLMKRETSRIVRPKVQRQFSMTTGSARRVRYTSTESDIRDWDLVHVRDMHMIVHHVSIMVGMTAMVTIILVTGETAGAIATGALASQDGIQLLRDLMNRA